MITKTFQGRRLAELRGTAELTQGDLAYRLRRNHGIRADQSQIANWEASNYAPRSSTVAALAVELNCSMEAFYGDGDADEEAEPSMVLTRAARVLAEHGEYELAAALHNQVVKKGRAA